MTAREHAIHRQVAAGLSARGIVHRPGLEGMLTAAQRRKAAEVGMRAGWPDVHIPAQHGRPDIWIELKTPGKRPTDEQLRTMAWLEAQGAQVAWFDDAGKALAFVDAVWSKSITIEAPTGPLVRGPDADGWYCYDDDDDGVVRWRFE